MTKAEEQEGHGDTSAFSSPACVKVAAVSLAKTSHSHAKSQRGRMLPKGK